MMKKKCNLVIVGLGGQGILFIAKTISRAVMKKGHNVMMNEVHGMAQRGGTVVTNVRIGPVHSPMIADGQADVILSTELNETLRVIPKGSPDCLTVASSVPIYPLSSYLGFDQYPPEKDIRQQIEDALPRVLFIDPFTIAKECGYTQAANVVLLGGLVATGILPVNKDEVLKTIKENVGFWMWRVDRKAFIQGYETIKKQIG
jgi:indolepyruvate ferredoxin oxidoreductase beta subunit